jgi:hypothetical protein
LSASLLLSFTRLDASPPTDTAPVLPGRALEIVDDRRRRENMTMPLIGVVIFSRRFFACAEPRAERRVLVLADPGLLVRTAE